MVISVSNDISAPFTSHMNDLIKIIRSKILLFLFFSFIWSFFIEDLISKWLHNIPLGDSPLNLSIYGPYDWIEIQWSMTFLLGIISTMPFISYSLLKFTSIGLLPKEKMWFSVLLIFTLFVIPLMLIIMWIFILPNFLSSFDSFNSVEGVGKNYDASAIFKLTLGLSWIIILFSLTTISLGLARLIGVFDSKNSTMKLKIVTVSSSLVILSLPNEFEGLRIVVALFIIYLSDIVSRTLPTSPLGLRSFNVDNIISSSGESNRIAIVDCSCEGVCPKIPKSFVQNGIAIPKCNALCLYHQEQNSLLDLVVNYDISSLIITGCDGKPIPSFFQDSLNNYNCDLKGLEWLDSEFSGDISWKLNSLEDSYS
jgi:Sec-independent protein secretion pathway component TatC